VAVVVTTGLLAWVREPRPAVPPSPPAALVREKPERAPAIVAAIGPPAVQNAQPVAQSSDGVGPVPQTTPSGTGGRPSVPTNPSQDGTAGPPSGERAEKRPRDVETEIRGVLARYVQAIERKDLKSLRLVRPGLKENEQERFARWFELTRTRKVDLTVQDVRVSGDQAIVTGRREDRVVTKNDQTIRSDVRFVYTLVRHDRGWVIQELKETSDARDDRARRDN
jgi:ketosteroid isomerase-like protein